jgi:hypothetical protein
MSGEWVQVGELSVDSGTIMLGDPCYSLDHHPGGDRSAYFRAVGLDGTSNNYRVTGAGDVVHVDDQNVKQVTKVGHDFVDEFVTVTTGFGDGIYPVYVRMDPHTGRVAEVKVVFIEDEG